LYPNKFIHCNFDGRAFVRTCPRGQIWKQSILSCVPNNDRIRIPSFEPQRTSQSFTTQTPKTTSPKLISFFNLPFNDLNIPNGIESNTIKEKNSQELIPIKEIELFEFIHPQITTKVAPIFKYQSSSTLKPIQLNQALNYGQVFSTLQSQNYQHQTHDQQQQPNHQYASNLTPIDNQQTIDDNKILLKNPFFKSNISQNLNAGGLPPLRPEFGGSSINANPNNQTPNIPDNTAFTVPPNNINILDMNSINFIIPTTKTIDSAFLKQTTPSSNTINNPIFNTNSNNFIVPTTKTINSMVLPQTVIAQNTSNNNDNFIQQNINYNLQPTKSMNFNSQYQSEENTQNNKDINGYLNSYNNFIPPNNDINIEFITATASNQLNNILHTSQIINNGLNEQSLTHNLPNYHINDFDHNQNIIDFGHLPFNQEPIINPKPVNIADYLTEEDFEYILEFLHQNETFNQQSIQSQVIPTGQQQQQLIISDFNTNTIFPYNPNAHLVPSEIKPVKLDLTAQSSNNNNNEELIQEEIAINGFSGADFREICIEAHAAAEASGRGVNDDDFLNAAKATLDSKIVSALLSNGNTDFFS
jgi:hypothetical protein